MVKKKLVELGPMRPGKLSQQYRKPAEKEIPFWQMNYTRTDEKQVEIRADGVATPHLQGDV
jgi:hypothetical protein